MPCPKPLPVTSDLSYKTKDQWEIARSSIVLIERLGAGQFGEVWRGELTAIPILVADLVPTIAIGSWNRSWETRHYLRIPEPVHSCGILFVLFSLHCCSAFLCVLRNLCLLLVLGRPCRVNSPSFPLPCSIQSYRRTCSTHASSRFSVCNILCYEPRADNIIAKNRHACSLCDWRRARLKGHVGGCISVCGPTGENCIILEACLLMLAAALLRWTLESDKAVCFDLFARVLCVRACVLYRRLARRITSSLNLALKEDGFVAHVDW